jgi:hypothetical protein
MVPTRYSSFARELAHFARHLADHHLHEVEFLRVATKGLISGITVLPAFF